MYSARFTTRACVLVLLAGVIVATRIKRQDAGLTKESAKQFPLGAGGPFGGGDLLGGGSPFGGGGNPLAPGSSSSPAEFKPIEGKEMGALDGNAQKPSAETAPSCFTAKVQEQITIPLLGPTLVTGKMYYDASKSCRIVEADGIKIIARFDIGKEVTLAEGQDPVVKDLPQSQGNMFEFKGSPFLGAQQVGGVDSVAYGIDLGDFAMKVWFKRSSPHYPVYSAVKLPMVGWTHQSLADHDGKCPVMDCDIKEYLPVPNAIFGEVSGSPVIMVIDESGSMDSRFEQSTRRAVAKGNLEKVLTDLPESTKFNVVMFASSAQVAFKEPVQSTSGNITAMIAKLRNSGGTNSFAALELAYKQAEGASDPKIYFLSDGSPNGSPEAILSELKSWDPTEKIPINSIMVGKDSEKAVEFMKKLADKTGGTFKQI